MMRAVGALSAVGENANLWLSRARTSKMRKCRQGTPGGIKPGDAHVIVAEQGASDRVAIYVAEQESYQIYSLSENVSRCGISGKDAEDWVAGRLVIVSGREATAKPWVVLLVILLSSISTFVLLLLAIKLLF